MYPQLAFENLRARERLPAKSFCVTAGILSREKTTKIMGGLRSVGIRHVSFKPGSVLGCRIAAANLVFLNILQ